MKTKTTTGRKQKTAGAIATGVYLLLPIFAISILHSELLPLPGIAAISCYLVYASYWIRLKKAENILWACHLGCLLVGIGWLVGWPLGNAIGVLWLAPGLIFWGIYLAGGGEFYWNSLFIHIGGLAIGLWGAAVLGFPAGTWWKAWLACLTLTLISRRISRPSENVNISVQVWTGWEQRFPSYRVFFAGLVLGAGILSFALETLIRWWLRVD